jgi:hypothetical protein
MNSALLAVVLASVAAPAPPEPPPKPPEGAPPATVIASITKEGDVEITQAAMVPMQEQRQRVVTIDGRAVTETYQVTTFKTVPVTHRIKGDAVKVYTAAGKEVEARDVPEKLKKQTTVLFAADGKKVDPFYLKIIKPDTLVIVGPPPSPAPVAPAPPKPSAAKPPS